ncbi:MAG TPA: hypothetical protein VFY42_05770, partial [Gemmatimonadales bacterium]|nr:hypothetical protein [Gemmatimonadales bacterium]
PVVPRIGGHLSTVQQALAPRPRGVQLGLGATLLLALAGVGLGATAHALAHWLDRELGGSATDPWYLSAFVPGAPGSGCLGME